MRKKTMAVLLAGAVAAAGIIGLTACKKDSGNGLQKGEQVSEEQWKTAIAATAGAENYTSTFTNDYQVTATGKIGDKSVTYNYTSNSTETSYYDFTNKKYYAESSYTDKTSGGELMGETDGEESETYKEYIEARALTIWSTEFDSEENEWYVDDSYTYPSAETLASNFKDNSNTDFLASAKLSTTKEGATTTISELYSAFTYKDGFYTATLYSYGQEATVTISVKGGYVVGVLQEGTNETTNEALGISSKVTIKAVYTFSNFGSTTVTTPEGAAAAITAAATSTDN
ncbi:MAG: hypothetical protein K2K60_05640 [Clostridia bacterium]|nr:hypothetical protein [Clostridia bacterium]